MGEGRSALWMLTRTRLAEFSREPGVVFWVFVFPILLAVALGIAFRSQPAEVPSVGIPADAPAWFTDALVGTDAVAVERGSEAELALALRDGDIDVIAVAREFPPLSSESTRIEFRFDPTRPGASAARTAVDDALQRALGRADAVRTEDHEVDAPGQRYIDFVFPGLLGMNLMSTSLWGIGFALVRLRDRKLLKVLAATPMRRTDFLLAMFGARALWLVFEVALLVGFGWLVFDVEVQGSFAAVFALSFLGAAAFAALGLVIGSRTSSSETANGWISLVQLPMWLLSGTFFSYERFPEWMLPIIRALPLTALNDSLRAVVLDGDSLLSCGLELGVMAAWAIVAFVAARVLIRWM